MSPSAPLAIDLFAGLGGWADGLLAEGYAVVGFDIERHEYGVHRYPAQLVIQDVLTLHGSQFRDAALIVASPPCQEFSYMAMPWSMAKAKATAIRADKSGKMRSKLTQLFDACFRIRREAEIAAHRHIPLIIENVRGAQPWVGQARWNWGSFYLWGDVPALMPITFKGLKVPGLRFDGSGRSFQSASVALVDGVKADGSGWRQSGTMVSTNRMVSGPRNGAGRKAASAMIAKIPLPLSRHIAATFRPRDGAPIARVGAGGGAP